MEKIIPQNVVDRALELEVAGQLSKTDICEAIKAELAYELSRAELVEIVLAKKDGKLLTSTNKDA